MPAILRTGRVCESRADVACILRGSSNYIRDDGVEHRGSSGEGFPRAPPPKPPLYLWRCQPLIPNGYVPFLVYMLGRDGPDMGSGMFEFVADSDVGVVFIVVSDGMLPRLRGNLGARNCSLSSNSLPRATIRAETHYSRAFDMEKLLLLAHMPQEEERVVLLDADTFCTPSTARAFGHVFEHMSGSQIVAGSLSGAFHTDDINSGVLAVDLKRMRAWERSFCPGSVWFACVYRFYNRPGRPGYNAALPGPHKSRPTYTDLADQGLWSSLLVDHPELWRCEEGEA